MKLFVHQRSQAHIDTIVQRPSGTILLHGVSGVGKATVAKEIARRVACEGCQDASCTSCKLAQAGSHPDIILVEPDEKGTIGMQAVEHLHHSLTYRPYQHATRRTAIIRNAEALSLPAQNALLKLLEEPPVDTLMILTVTDQTALLGTVLSRCRSVYLPKLSSDQIEQAIMESTNLSATEARLIADASNGAIGTALALARDGARQQQQQRIGEAISRLTRGTLFDRLQAVAELPAKTIELSPYMNQLIHQSHQQVRSRTTATADILEATQRLQQRLKANVAPRAALEAYVMETAI